MRHLLSFLRVALICSILVTNCVKMEDHEQVANRDHSYIDYGSIQHSRSLQDTTSTYRTGGAMAFIGKCTATITNCTFENLSMSSGVIYASQPYSDDPSDNSVYNITDCTFRNNTAVDEEGGGALYFENTAEVNIKNSTFEQNSAISGDGGALKLKCSGDNCGASLDQCVFSENYAFTTGGAIDWNLNEPEGISTSTFVDNQAVEYGLDISGIPIYMGKITFETDENGDYVDTSQSREKFVIDNHQSGTALPNFYLAIFDKYDNIVTYGADDVVETRVISSSNDDYFVTSLSNQTSFVLEDGMTLIEGLILSCDPDSSQMIEFVYTESVKFNVTVNVRECLKGERLLSSGACQECEAPNYYSIETDFSQEVQCNLCPSHVKCLGGSEIYPKSSYWRIDDNTDTFYLCPGSEACLGYVKDDPVPEGKCETGYKGILCGECENGYSRGVSYSCRKCPHMAITIISIIAFIAVLVIYSVINVVIIFRNSSGRKNGYKLSVILRMVMNYIHIMVIVMSFELNWPSSLSNIFNFLQPLLDAPAMLLSIECFIGNKDNLSMPHWGIEVLITISLPIIILIVVFSVYGVYYIFILCECCKKRENNRIIPQPTFVENNNRRASRSPISNRSGAREGGASDSEIRISSIITDQNQREIEYKRKNFLSYCQTACYILILFVHPSIVNTLSGVFVSKTVYDKEVVLLDTSYTYMEGWHKTFFIISVIFFLIWGFGIPFYIMGAILSDKDRSSDRSGQILGFIYQGYTYKNHYWEGIIIIRKVLLILVAGMAASKGKLYQSIWLLIIIAISIGIQILRKPFLDHHLNSLEELTLITAFIIVIYGFIMMSNEASENSDSRDNFEAHEWLNFVFFIFLIFCVGYFILKCIDTALKAYNKSVRSVLAKFFEKCTKNNTKSSLDRSIIKQRDYHMVQGEILDSLEYLSNKYELNVMDPKNEKELKKIIYGYMGEIDRFESVLRSQSSLRRSNSNIDQTFENMPINDQTRLQDESKFEQEMKHAYKYKNKDASFDQINIEDDRTHLDSKSKTANSILQRRKGKMQSQESFMKSNKRYTLLDKKPTEIESKTINNFEEVKGPFKRRHKHKKL